MATLITDRQIEQRLRYERKATGADRYDEVWEGTHMMAPRPNVEHQVLVNRIASIFQEIVGWPGVGLVLPGVNVSDREERWHENYRVPDVAVFLNHGSAKNCDTHWCGGPDLAVEIISPDDHTRNKFSFYGEVGTRELLLVDRAPWQLELYRLRETRLTVVGTSTVARSESLTSDVLPFSFRLVPGDSRPQLEVKHSVGDKTWFV